MRDEANARRKRPANRAGCKPIEDVCVEHDRPLVCRHGCDEARIHAKGNGPVSLYGACWVGTRWPAPAPESKEG